MANEFVARKGLIVSGSTSASGSITAFSFTGSILGTASQAISSSYVPNLYITASDVPPTYPDVNELWYDSTTGKTYLYYKSASVLQWVLQADPTYDPGPSIQDLQDVTDLGSTTTNAITITNTTTATDSSSGALIVSGGVGVKGALYAGTVNSTTVTANSFVGTLTGTATTASYVTFTNVANKPALVSSSTQFKSLTEPFTGSFTGSFTGELIGTSSWATNAVSSSYALTASYALNGGTGTAGNSFATFSIAGQSDVIADSATDTMTLAAGSGIVLTTNPTTDTITIAATAADPQAFNIDTYEFIGDGATANYNIVNSYSINSLIVSVDGITYTPSDDYTLSTNTLTFLSTPPSQSNILVRAFVNATTGVTGSFTGSFSGLILGQIESASYATTASAATSITFTPLTASFATTASAATSITFTPSTASFAITSSAANSITFIPTTANTASYVEFNNIANKPSLVSSSLQINTGSFSGSFTGELIGTSSWANKAISSSFATSASWAPAGATVGPGTSASIALFDTSNTVSSSIMFQSGSSVVYSDQPQIYVNGGITTNAGNVEILQGYELHLFNVNSSNSYYLINGGNVGTGNGDLRFLRRGSPDITTMYLGSTGNVGIGTTAPQTKLQINGNISASSYTSSISNAVGFLGTSSWADNATSASFTTTASTANSITFIPPTASFSTTASAATSITFTPSTASFATTASAATSITFTPTTSSFATTASAATSITFTPTTASFAITASYAQTAGVSGLKTKVGSIANTSFTGNPRKAAVNFSSPFGNTNYAVVITGEDARSWTVEGKVVGGFTASANSNTGLTGTTYWIATLYGET